jgi:hypothetical protein
MDSNFKAFSIFRKLRTRFGGGGFLYMTPLLKLGREKTSLLLAGYTHTFCLYIYQGNYV